MGHRYTHYISDHDKSILLYFRVYLPIHVRHFMTMSKLLFNFKMTHGRQFDIHHQHDRTQTYNYQQRLTIINLIRT